MTRSLQCKIGTTSYLLHEISRVHLILNCNSSSKVTAYRLAAKYSPLSTLKKQSSHFPFSVTSSFCSHCSYLPPLCVFPFLQYHERQFKFLCCFGFLKKERKILCILT